MVSFEEILIWHTLAYSSLCLTKKKKKQKNPNGLGAEMTKSFQKFLSLHARSHSGCFKLEKWEQQYQEANVSERDSINYVCSHWYMYYCDVTEDGQPCLCLFNSIHNLFSKSLSTRNITKGTQRLFGAYLSLFLAYRIVVFLKWFFFKLKK